jgi:phage terminase small subunit
LKTPRAPTILKQKGKIFWRKVLSEYDLSDAHDLERLKMACRCLDELNDVEMQVETDGLFQIDRYGGIKEHVGLKTIRNFRLLFCRIIREMGLDTAVIPEPRIPRGRGY